MAGVGIIGAIIIGLLAGWIAQQLVSGGSGGLVTNLVVGLIGALIGPVVLGALGIWQGSGFLPSLVVSTIGAIVLLFIVRALRRASPRGARSCHRRGECLDRSGVKTAGVQGTHI